MKSKKVRALVISLSVILILALAGVTAVQVFFRLPQPQYSGSTTIDGLKSRVEVRTDDYGVPHIFAQNETDLFFAQGYITARERMFQMDTTRLAGRGELSTYMGEATINADKFFKTLGFYRAAETEYANLPPEAKSALDAYTQGVNAYISTVKNLPSEYTILGVKPPPWKPQDSMVAGLLMAYSLNRSKDTELILYQIGATAGNDTLNQIIPSLPPYAPTVSQAPGSPSLDTSQRLLPVPLPEPGLAKAEQFYSPFPLDTPASNWMIFSGSRTTTGKAVFAGSPDLAPTIPALFYLIHLKGGDYDVIGGSIAGVPGINVLGFNEHVAWSTTNGRGDELDYFIEKVNPDNPDQYLTEDGYRDFKIIEEPIKVKTRDGFREETLKVRVSRHGPIISDVIPNSPKDCAMMWVGFQPHLGIMEGFLALDRARNFTEFRKALSVVRTPTLNIGYADVDGNIGYQYIASFPIRKAGDGTMPVPGEKGEYDWVGYVPFENLPHDYNPAKGYFASFNNVPQKTDYHMTDYWMFERATRFKEIAESKDKFSIDEIRKMQLDRVSMVAKRWVPLIFNACNDMQELKPQLALFKGWDYSIDMHSPAATLFNSFYAHFIQDTLEDNIGQKNTADLLSPLQAYIPDMMLANIINDNNNAIFDDLRTPGVKETRDDIIRKSMKEAANELSARLGSDPATWEWGKVHAMTFKHPLGSKLPFYNLSPIPTHGDDYTINAGAWDSHNPYAFDTGGVIRMVVDMSNLENATLMSPPGQSGLYMSPYYSDLAAMWAGGFQIPAHFLSANQLPQVLILEAK